jgi:LysM repeat protein
VGPYFASKIPTGTAAPKTLPAAEAAPEVTPTPTASPTASPIASPTPTVSPSPKPSVSASPKPSVSPSAIAKTYVVVSGDTISRIAAKFGVTSTALMLANKITNANLIKIGQVLVIP